MNMCHRCFGVKKLVVGALLLLNGFVWPKWLGIDGWVLFIAVLMLLGGFLMLVFPNKCAQCNACMGGGMSKEAKPIKGKK